MAREIRIDSPDFNGSLWDASLAKGSTESRLIFTGDKYLIPLDYSYNLQTKEEKVICYCEASPEEYQTFLNWTNDMRNGVAGLIC